MRKEEIAVYIGSFNDLDDTYPHLRLCFLNMTTSMEFLVVTTSLVVLTLSNTAILFTFECFPWNTHILPADEQRTRQQFQQAMIEYTI